jgi:hypothetical protein
MARLPLAFSAETYFEIPMLFRGPRFVFGTENRFTQWLSNLGKPVATIDSGFSVVNYSFSIARAMGADPIIFSGLDLAFDGEKHHSINCNKTWGRDHDRFDYPWVQGVGGDMLQTVPSFIAAKTMLEQQISMANAECIDATEGGALIKGARMACFEEIASIYHRSKETDYKGLFGKMGLPQLPHNPSKITASLSWFLESADDLETLAQEAMDLLGSLETDGANPAKGIKRRLFDEINRISDDVQHYAEFIDLVKDQMPGVLVNQFHTPYHLQRAKTDSEKESILVQKSTLFFDRLLMICQTVRRHLPETLMVLYASFLQTSKPQKSL